MKLIAHPITWYALEGKEEIPVRLRALEASLKGKKPQWGDDRAPVTVLDRIPEDYREWRAEISRIGQRWENIFHARNCLKEMPSEIKKCVNAIGIEDHDYIPHYPAPDAMQNPPVIVIDTLSIALGGEDEKGPKAVDFIINCLDLLKERPDFACPYKEDAEAFAEWRDRHPTETQ
jgi:hypothetical protein